MQEEVSLRRRLKSHFSYCIGGRGAAEPPYCIVLDLITHAEIFEEILKFSVITFR